MGTDYSPNLKQALTRDLRALRCHVEPDDISIRERPDGDYAVEVRVRTDTVDIPVIMVSTPVLARTRNRTPLLASSSCR